LTTKARIMNHYEIEREVTSYFVSLVDTVGYDRADLMFEEAGLNLDDEKDIRAIEIARRLTLGGDDD